MFVSMVLTQISPGTPQMAHDGLLVEPRSFRSGPNLAGYDVSDASAHDDRRRDDRIAFRDIGIAHFRVVRADTPQLRQISYRLRYDVYCVEHSFLDAACHPDRRESDEFDSHSLHALLQHAASGAFVGTVRLVMPRPDHPGLAMPFASLCRDPRMDDILPHCSTAEVSRFAISKSFRRRAGDSAGVDPSRAATRADRRVAPNLSLGLILAITQMALASGIIHVCAVMEPTLLRLLRGLGIVFTPLGPPVEYHGLRQPCYARCLELLDQVRTARPDHWAVITDRGRLLPQLRSNAPSLPEAAAI